MNTIMRKRALAARNLMEAVTWSFIAKPIAELFGGGAPELALANPIAADLSDMRPSLIPGLAAAAERNARRGFRDIGLFEVGQIFLGAGERDQRIAAAGLRLGLSTHGFHEMLIALHFRPSYLAMGAVFPTTTKQMPTAPQGLVRLAHYVALLRGKIPLVAIGGIDASVIDAVLATGVGCAAVVRAVTEAPDLPGAVRNLQARFR